MQIREIEDFPNYIIYIDARVQNLKTKRFLKPQAYVNGYLFVRLCNNGKRKDYLLSRLIAKHFILNPEKKECVDHFNGNWKDNSIDNLRWCTSAENSRNLKCHREKEDVGITWHKRAKKWQARITYLNKTIYLGCFINKEDAIQARKEGERKYWNTE